MWETLLNRAGGAAENYPKQSQYLLPAANDLVTKRDSREITASSQNIYLDIKWQVRVLIFHFVF